MERREQDLQIKHTIETKENHKIRRLTNSSSSSIQIKGPLIKSLLIKEIYLIIAIEEGTFELGNLASDPNLSLLPTQPSYCWSGKYKTLKNE